MTDRIAGKAGPHVESHEPRLLATNFISTEVPLSGYNPCDVTHGITKWGMDDNDSLGCCGFAAVDHANVAKLGDATQAGWSYFPMFKSLAAAYFAYGLAQGEVGPPANPNEPDQGVSNALMLGWLYKLGLIDGYAEIPLDQLDWFVARFNGVITGLAINDNTAIHDFEVGAAWDVMLNENGGHDVLARMVRELLSPGAPYRSSLWLSGITTSPTHGLSSTRTTRSRTGRRSKRF
jgi:hypothetical protein